ncbi:MAG TPA: hypothetical protein VGK73_16735 [Polyangiaceae bacterium]
MVRESLFLLALICALPLACGADSTRRRGDRDDAGAAGADDGRGGTSGSAGNAGAAGRIDTAGSAGSGARAGSGSGGGGAPGGGSGANGGEGNAAGTVGTAGSGEGGEAGTSGGSGGGGQGGSAGAGGSSGLPVVNPIPAEGAAHELPSGDTLNSTPPVIAALGDDIVIAGYTQDPRLAGLTEFPSGQLAETFAARLDRAGQLLWSRSLPGSGIPNAIAIDAQGDIVISASYLPERNYTIYMGSYTEAVYLAKLRPSGDVVYAREIPFDSGVMPYGMTVDPGGAIYVSGGYMNPDQGNNAFTFLAKYDAEGRESWTKIFEHTGTWSSAEGVAVLPNGEVTITGGFNGTIDFGGGALTTEASDGTFASSNGFLARFTASGEHVESTRFGGTVYDSGTDVVALSDGDLVLTGSISGVSELGGKTANGGDGAPFLARVAPDGSARFFEVAPGTGTPYTLVADPGEGLFHLTGWFGENHVLFEFGPNGELGLAAIVSGTQIWSHGLAVDSAGSLWVSGGFQYGIDFGGGVAFEADDKGVFLVRLDRRSP